MADLTMIGTGSSSGHNDHMPKESRVKLIQVPLFAAVQAALMQSVTVSAQVLPAVQETELNGPAGICPTKIAGDRDFFGNGPAVTLDSSLTVDFNTLRVGTSFRAVETQSNFSEATFTTDELQFRAPHCAVISGIGAAGNLIGNPSNISFTDTDHNLDEIMATMGSFVENVIVRGDTSNDDIGNCTTDDTKYWVFPKTGQHVVLDVDDTTAECLVNGNPLTPVESTPLAVLALESELNNLAGRIEVRLDNADLSTGTPTIAPNASFFQVIAPNGTVESRATFTLPTFKEGRYEFFVDKLDSQAVRFRPDGGGLMLEVDFDTSGGSEIVSRCDDDVRWHPDWGFIHPWHVAWADNESEELACLLGNPLTFDLASLRIAVRLFVVVDPATGILSFRNVEQHDVFISMIVGSQTGPCEDNVLAIADDCMEVDELSVELPIEIRPQLATLLNTVVNDPADGLTRALRTFGTLPGVVSLILFGNETTGIQRIVALEQPAP